MNQTLATAERTYQQLKKMAMNYEFKPDSRLNESELAKQLQASRTPLREALNRLVAEGFLTIRHGQGFFSESLTTQKMMNLYEVRSAIECEAAKLAAIRANPKEIESLEQFLNASQADYKPGTSPDALIKLDEAFHMRVTALAGNEEMVRTLGILNGRIHYFRLIDLKTLCEKNGHEVVTTDPHRRILEAIKRRDPEAAQKEMSKHIERRVESITDNVRNAFAQIYAPS